MTVGDPRRQPRPLAPETDRNVNGVTVKREQVEQLLSTVDVNKVTFPDNVSPRLLKHCATELSGPLADVRNVLKEKQVTLIVEGGTGDPTPQEKFKN